MADTSKLIEIIDVRKKFPVGNGFVEVLKE
jgi:hypothetical protein